MILEQVGVAKPHIDIFNHAFSLMGHPPKQHILMVGDNPHADIQGGINAGIDTCWLNRHGAARPDGITRRILKLIRYHSCSSGCWAAISCWLEKTAEFGYNLH
ncbi:hypothetical protein GCM10027181_36420 [Rheinheimera gaetbuli]